MILVMLAGAVPLFAESKSLFSFEEWEWDYPTGVGFWADAESRKPAYSRSDDVADGKSALKVEFFGCKSFRGSASALSIFLHRPGTSRSS